MSLSRIKLISLNFRALIVPFISAKEFHSFDTDSEDVNAKTLPHIPVMAQEVVDILNLKDDNLFLDMTFGAGGHCSALLENAPNLRVLALDRDPYTEKYMKELSERYSNNITPLIGKFSDLPALLEEKQIEFGTVDGVLLDLGCSSMQLDNAERGFSYTHSGPIDMRMDGDRIPNSITAAHVIEGATEIDLSKIFKTYGEERHSIKIARAIVQSRYNFQPLRNTRDLADLIETVCLTGCNSKNAKPREAVTRIFQSLRIFVNNELNELHYGMMLAYKYLKPGGRIIAITFHSLEDKIVKAHFKNQVNYNGDYISPFQTKINDTYNFEKEKLEKYWSEISSKTLVPAISEILLNPRSRSAKLRTATKC